MSFVTAFMALTTAFVLVAPLAMALVLVTGGVRRTRPATVRAGCTCAEDVCPCPPGLPVAA